MLCELRSSAAVHAHLLKISHNSPERQLGGSSFDTGNRNLNRTILGAHFCRRIQGGDVFRWQNAPPKRPELNHVVPTVPVD